jgi:hypothetical protein
MRHCLPNQRNSSGLGDSCLILSYAGNTEVSGHSSCSSIFETNLFNYKYNDFYCSLYRDGASGNLQRHMLQIRYESFVNGNKMNR